MESDPPGTQGRYNKVLEIIDDRLIPDYEAKKARGEVFTPLSLVRKMLFGLRKKEMEAGKEEIWGIDDEGNFIDEDEENRVGGIPLEDVWRNPESKFLDPANGIGNFPVVAFQMLDYQLGKHGKDPKYRGDKNTGQRRKHIIEKMLYMLEIDKGNVNTTKKVFGLIHADAKPNICCTDSLTLENEDLIKNFGIDKFDVIMGNPPFQAPQEASGKRGGGDELYMKFVKWSINLVKPNCYLSFVHPPSWRKPEFEEGRKKSKNSGMFKLMAHDNQLEYLEIHDAQDGIREFKASTRYDFYLLIKRPVYKKTFIKDMLGKLSNVNLKKYGFLPNFNITNIEELIASSDESTCSLDSCILYSASSYETRRKWVCETKSAEFKFPLINSTPKGGIKYMYSSVNDRGFFGIKKVIFGESGINNPVIDLKGEYGMTQGAMAIVVKNKKEGDDLIDFLKSNFFINILNSCMWGNFRIDWRLFTYFKEEFWNVEYDKDEELIHINTEKQRETLKSKRPGKKSGGARRPFDKTRKRRRVM